MKRQVGRREANLPDSLSSQLDLSGNSPSTTDEAQRSMQIEIGSVDTNGVLVWTPIQDTSLNGSWVRITIPRQVLLTWWQRLGISSPSGSSTSLARALTTFAHINKSTAPASLGK